MKKKIFDFIKKYWIYILVGFAVLSFFGIIRKLITKIRVWFLVSSGADPLKDYNHIAEIINGAITYTWFDWNYDQKLCIDTINQLQSAQDFNNVCNKYALLYSLNLHYELKEKLSDSQFNSLLYK
jgi:hypothetical protein